MTRSLGAPTSRPLTLFDPVLHAPSGRSGRESSIWKPRVTHFEIQTSGHEQDEEEELRILVVGCSTWHRGLDDDANIIKLTLSTGLRRREALSMGVSRLSGSPIMPTLIQTQKLGYGTKVLACTCLALEGDRVHFWGGWAHWLVQR